MCHIRTYVGFTVNPLDLRPEQIDIQDIAHALACINRFNGHLMEPISVAQHSVYASWFVDSPSRKIQLQALLHDAAEAYLGDVTKWLKASPAFTQYREAEARAQAVIFQKFNCATDLHPLVEEVDRLLVRAEARRGFGNAFRFNHPDYPPLNPRELQRVQQLNSSWTWQESESYFLARFGVLYSAS